MVFVECMWCSFFLLFGENIWGGWVDVVMGIFGGGVWYG